MTNVADKYRCENCLELQRSLVKTLGEKRSLLLRLQKEQARIRKLLREAEKSKKRNEEEQSVPRDISRPAGDREGGGECLEWQLNEVMEVNKKWKEDYDTLKIKHETECQLLQKELDLTKEKLADSETQVLALGSEVGRLATTLNELYQRHGGSTSSSSLLDVDDYEVFKQQIQVYKEDFSIERRDREQAQSEKDYLQQQLVDAQEVIATLTQEVEIYKSQLNESREETKRLRRHSDPPLHSSCPQLQIIYPVNEPTSASQWQWRQEQQRRGILTRGTNHYTAPSSLFYGGDVEVDRKRT